MYVFSNNIQIPAGATLAGFSSLADVKTTEVGCLEVHGLGRDGDDGWQICVVDALYAGVLTKMQKSGLTNRIIAATHTHYAPLLDNEKSSMGHFSHTTAAKFEHAISTAAHRIASPDRCSLLVGETDVPIYRRFDYPDAPINKILTRFGGLYPNDAHPVDRKLYIFVFFKGEMALFAIAYHACHPVSRHTGNKASPDYIGAVRAAIHERFGVQHCLFFLGCAGDIRPNLTQKRTKLLPRNRLNWRFRAPSIADETVTDAKYQNAVRMAQPIKEFSIMGSSFHVANRNIAVHGLGCIDVPYLNIGTEFSFAFLPFEVSHRYQLEVTAAAPRHFIVSCANNMYGYLPHRDQQAYGGYEVDTSRIEMGIPRRIAFDSADLWPL